METTTRIRSSFAAALLVVMSLIAAMTQPAGAKPGAICEDGRTTLAVVSPPELTVRKSVGHIRSLPAAYTWPVKPFDRQHPIRANLDDPRIGAEGGAAFHFGIDIVVPDGTPVYAVTGGEAYVRPGDVAVVDGPNHEFGYWHIRAAVLNHQPVRRHQLLGWVLPGWEHVHFAERKGDVYLNPLRPGGLGPYTDTTVPSVRQITAVRTGSGFEIVASAYDMPSPSVPGAWANEPITPALLRWRMIRNGALVSGWRTVVDFRSQMLDRSRFRSVYAPATRQNHKSDPGQYCFFLSRTWKPADGRYRIEVAASDTRANRAVARLDFTVEHGLVGGA